MSPETVLKFVIESIFAAAHPKRDAQETAVREIMISCRHADVWTEKLQPLRIGEEAYAEALPRLIADNRYRAKQIWIERTFGGGFDVARGFHVCKAILSALRGSESFSHLLWESHHARGRPRGKISRNVPKPRRKKAA